MINIDIEHFKARLLQDALTEATAQCWIHRAHQFQQAAPRKGDYHGLAGRDELLDRWERCKATEQACLRHAQLVANFGPEPISTEVWEVLEEVT
jgi:hypothetical protein